MKTSTTAYLYLSLAIASLLSRFFGFWPADKEIQGTIATFAFLIIANIWMASNNDKEL